MNTNRDNPLVRLAAPFASAATYRSLGYLLSAIPVGAAGLAVLIAGWSIAVPLAITPLCVPALLGFRAVLRGLSLGEAALAHSLLGVEGSVPPPRRTGRGFWRAGFDVLADAPFWRQQAFVVWRYVGGGVVAVAFASLLASGGFLVVLPIVYRWTGPDVLDGRRIDSFVRALACVPFGVLIVVATVHAVGPAARLSAAIARLLLVGRGRPSPPEERSRVARLSVVVHAWAAASVVALLVAVWLIVGRGGFWPAWPIVALALVLGLHAWPVLVLERRWPAPSLAIHAGLAAWMAAFLVAVWALAGGGTFWPIWAMLAFAILLAAHGCGWYVRSRQLEGRVEELTLTRAGAVDEQHAELRRIERDLHDGAQARLVALGMSLGLAEQKLATDPAGARALVAEARAGAHEALEELRDLARGIHPPVLADRGLVAAIEALVARTPLRVSVDGDGAGREEPVVETAAYFVVAEALANAGKHAGANDVQVSIARRGDRLVVRIADDGTGGADPAGGGLTGLRRRVEALDGTLRIASPPGGPTIVEAELPCAS